MASTSTYLALGGLAVLGLYLYSKRDPIKRTASGAPAAGQSTYLDAARNDALWRFKDEAEAKADPNKLRALQVQMFREGATREVIVPSNDPQLKRAQDVGYLWMQRHTLSEYQNLTDTEVLQTLSKSGVKIA